jgi:hypothetical protein
MWLPPVAEGEVVTPGTVLVGVTREVFPSLSLLRNSPVLPSPDDWYTVWTKGGVPIPESVDVPTWETTVDDLGSPIQQYVMARSLVGAWCSQGRERVAVTPPVWVREVVPTPEEVVSTPVIEESVAEGDGAAKAITSVPRAKKTASVVKATLSKARVSHAAKAKLRVKIAVKGVKSPTGKVRVTWDGGKRTVRLLKAHHGKVSVILPKLASGSHAVRVKFFSDSKVIQNSTSKPVHLKVI